MSTYIQGVTDYIPQVQPFVPDYNFYSGVLNFKQSKHDAARQQLSNVYGSLLNAPLTREDNSLARDKFFKTIEQDIKKMSTMDLSLAQNAEAAAGIFNQMLDNKSIVNDMVWTKQFNNQMQKGQALKNCVDPEQCGGSWWEGGDRYMAYGREAFKNASAEEAMNMRAPEYVAHQNVMTKAMKIANDAGLNVTYDSHNGGYKMTTKNGAAVEPAMQRLLLGTLGQDPKIASYYNAKASVDRQDWMHSNAEQYGGDLAAAEQAYIAKMSPTVEKMMGIESEIVEDELDTNKQQVEKIEKKIAESLPDERGDFEKLLDDYRGVGEEYNSSKKVLDNINGTINVAKQNQKYTSGQIDSILAGSYLQNDILSAANVMSQKDAERTFKADEYSLEAVKFQNRRLLERDKWIYKVKEMEYQAQLDRLDDPTSDVTETGGAESNVFQNAGTIPGSTDPTDDSAERVFNVLQENYKSVENDVSAEEKYLINQVYQKSAMLAERGDKTAMKDYISIVSSFLSAAEDDPINWSVDETSEVTGKVVIDPAKVKQLAKYRELRDKLANETRLEEKYKIARDAGMDLGSISGSQVDKMYDNTIPGMLVQDKDNLALREHLQPIMRKATEDGLLASIAVKDNILKQMNKTHGKQAKEVIERVADMGENGEFWKKTFGAYIDDNGNPVSEEEFVTNMMALQGEIDLPEDLTDAYGEQPEAYETAVRSMYRGNVEQTGPLKDFWSGLGSWLVDATDEPGLMTDDMKAYAAQDKIEDLNYGLHDFWKQVYSEKVSPDYKMGMGNFAGKQGGKMAIVDPAEIKSTSLNGTIGFLRDAQALDAQYTIGGFTDKEVENDPKAKAIADLALKAFLTEKKGANRINASITFTPIALNNKGVAGLNIKFNQGFINKHKGSKDSQGLTYGDMGTTLAEQGLTIYLDKAQASNLFVKGIDKTPVEKLMDTSNEIDLNYVPEYFEDFKIKRNDYTGGYTVSGMIKNGIKEDGTAKWTSFGPIEHAAGKDLNNMVSQYGQLISKVTQMNDSIKKKYLLENANKI